MSAIAPEQQALIDRLAGVLSADARVESVWLYGSLARGDGDAWSDVDLVAVVAEDVLNAVVRDYGYDLSTVAEIVHKQVLYGRIIHAVTDDWGRFDITFVTPVELTPRDAGAHVQLFARGNAAPAGGAPPVHAASAAEVEALIREFLRVLGLAPVGFGRRDYLLLLDGGVLLRTMIVDLMLAENGRARSERGAKRLTQMLTPAQIEALEALPPLLATRESAWAFNVAAARLFLPRARKLAEKLGVAWPAAFEDATRAHLQRALGLMI